MLKPRSSFNFHFTPDNGLWFRPKYRITSNITSIIQPSLLQLISVSNRKPRYLLYSYLYMYSRRLNAQFFQIMLLFIGIIVSGLLCTTYSHSIGSSRALRKHTSTSTLKVFTWMSRDLHTFLSASAYFLTPKITGRAVLYIIATLSRFST